MTSRMHADRWGPRKVRRRRWPLLPTGLLVCLAADPAVGDIARGEIRTDTVWQGIVRISADLSIGNAELRVMPGTRILFDKPAALGQGPVILLNAPIAVYKWSAPGARLVMLGTPENPIIIETPEGKPRGSILSGQACLASVQARHVVMRRMGRLFGKNICEPALQVRMGGDRDDTWITDCVFEECGPVEIECHGPQATADVRRCRFERAMGTSALILSGLGGGTKVIQDNYLDALLTISSPQVLVSRNLIVGPAAGIDVSSPAVFGLRITDNWIHRRHETTWGSNAVSCMTTRAVIIGNVIRGGNRALNSGAGMIAGNILIGDRLHHTTQPGERVSTVAADMPAVLLNLTERGTQVADNIFWGPCQAAITVGRTALEPTLARNLFDGADESQTAILFHEMPVQAPAATLTANVFLRYRRPPIRNPGRHPATLLEAADNVFIDTPSPAYEGLTGLDRICIRERYLTSAGSAGEMSISGSSLRDLPDRVEEELLAGRIDIPTARHRLWAAYADLCARLSADPSAGAGTGPRPDLFTPATPAIDASPSGPPPAADRPLPDAGR